MTLYVPTIDPDQDTISAAFAYAQAGWYVLPVRHGKHPGSRLGDGWPAKSSRDPETLIAWFAGTNDLLALHVGRSGAVAFDVDKPPLLHPLLRAALLTVPSPFQSTRADDLERGHYVYALPPNRILGNGGGQLGHAWGEVRGTNAVIVASPSEHTKTAEGGRYEWARTGTLPELPAVLSDALPDGSPGESAVTDAQLRSFLDAHDDVVRPELLKRRLKRLPGLIAEGASRHNTTLTELTLAFKEAAAGYFPAEAAYSEIREIFLHAVTRQHPKDPTSDVRSSDRAHAEFQGIAAWAAGQAMRSEATAEARAWVEEHRPADPLQDLFPPIAPPPVANVDQPSSRIREGGQPVDEHGDECFAVLLDGWPCSCFTSSQPKSADSWPNKPVQRRGLLPGDFWDARPVLRHIRQAAHARARSGDIVLGGLLARLSSLLPPELRADTGVGSPASMNMFVFLLGPSGAGKSSAAWIPRRLLPPPPRIDFLDELPLGTGEGIAEAYMGDKTVDTGEIYRSGPKKGDPKTETVRAQIRHNALFYADEGESLTKQLFGRNGATVGESIRRAWTGGTIGQFNGHKVNTRVIESGTYSLGLVVGFQPETALPILEDAPAGTPQRFLWVSATDPSIPEEVIDDPGPLNLALLRHGFGVTPKIAFASDILREIRRDDRARATGEMRLPQLDSHKPLMLVKLAVLLAILNSRLDVTAEDWQLAAIIWQTSCERRDALVEYGSRQQAEEAEKRTRAHVDREVRAHTAKVATEHDVERVARRAAKRVRDAGGLTRGALNKDTASRDRGYLPMSIDLADARGWITVDGDDLAPGDSAPA